MKPADNGYGEWLAQVRADEEDVRAEFMRLREFVLDGVPELTQKYDEIISAWAPDIPMFSTVLSDVTDDLIVPMLRSGTMDQDFLARLLVVIDHLLSDSEEEYVHDSVSWGFAEHLGGLLEVIPHDMLGPLLRDEIDRIFPEADR